MKRILFSVLTISILVSCNHEQAKYGVGGKNACQFVKEQVPEIRENLQSIEVIEEDSLLSDSGLAFGQVQFAKASLDYVKGNLSRSEYRHFLDSAANILNDVQGSWIYGRAYNDSLKQLEKHNFCWRKVYTVKVTMKSGVTKEPRVLMESDGVTPRMMEKEFERTLQKYNRDITDAYYNLTH